MTTQDTCNIESFAGNLRDLPFFCGGAWKPERSGDYGKDCETGNAAAAKILAMIERTRNPALLPAIVRAIIVTGEWSGIEIGFFNRLGIALV